MTEIQITCQATEEDQVALIASIRRHRQDLGNVLVTSILKLYIEDGDQLMFKIYKAIRINDRIKIQSLFSKMERFLLQFDARNLAKVCHELGLSALESDGSSLTSKTLSLSNEWKILRDHMLAEKGHDSSSD